MIVVFVFAAYKILSRNYWNININLDICVDWSDRVGTSVMEVHGIWVSVWIVVYFLSLKILYWICWHSNVNLNICVNWRNRVCSRVMEV